MEEHNVELGEIASEASVERAAFLSDAARHLGDLLISDDDDERLALAGSGQLKDEVVPEDEEGRWRSLGTPDELVQFYDPTDVFGDVAESIAEAYPSVASEEGPSHDADQADDEDDEDDEDADEVEDLDDGAEDDENDEADEAEDEARGDDRD
jgi:hypothetical protein